MKNQPKFVGLHASDLHISHRRFDEIFALEQIVDAAIHFKVAYIVLAGDLLDRQSNRADVVAAMHRELNRCQRAGISVYYIQGQHDFDEPPWLSSHSWPVHLHGKLVERGPFNLYGIDFQPHGKLRQALDAIPNSANLLVSHQVWSDWMGDIASPQGSFSEVPPQIRYMHTGDLHERKEETHKNLGGNDFTVISTGATTQRKITEPSSHYYALLTTSGEFVFHKLISRPFIASGLLSQEADLDTFLQRLVKEVRKAEESLIPEDLRKPLVHVVYDHRLCECVNRVTKFVADRATVTFKEVKPQKDEKNVVIAVDASVTPLTMLPEEVNAKERPKLYSLLCRLLQSHDPKSDLVAWKNEFLRGD
jgi:DNA repair exonuclease SbcCD nuclease subunit